MSIEINKYPPKIFKTGIFADWTGCHQIAKGGLAREEYLQAENRYVSAILRVIAGRAVETRNIEMWDEDAEVLRRIGLGDVLTDDKVPEECELVEGARLENIVRRCLRECAWMEIGIPRRLMIHFSYDMRVLVVSPDDLSLLSDRIRNEDGLFVYKSSPNLETVKGWML